MKKKTLLLVFIHGFQGGNDTFGNFPAHLRAIASHALPNIDVVAVTYPKFETRGDLQECVGRFREWLQNIVIDIEVSNNGPSPTVDPSVHVILIGHSMGGILGAETIRLLTSETILPTPSRSSTLNPSSGLGDKPKQEQGAASHEANPFMFPHIQGLMAFDTPFLGIAPGTVSYTAENHYKTASAAYGAITEVANVFGWGTPKKDTTASAERSSGNSAPLALPAPTSFSSSAAATTTPARQRWGRYALLAGAAGALAAGGAAALYTQRDRFSAGWTWATSHLEFVGCLARPEELRNRLAALAQLHKDRGLHCANFYTRLGRGAVVVPPSETPSATTTTAGGSSSPPQPFSISRHILRSTVRTFCNLPQDVENNARHHDRAGDEVASGSSEAGLEWIEAVNDKVADETKAHMSMFLPTENPAFYDMAHQARDLLIRWVDRGWYSAAAGG
ncbi:hypothetical protein PRK78_007195 [Emydomyces testavorans]|uniref:AB hydrolase-1 domain-containing protein n=1 Tax=Emydomyces testavorans TaxID=2070801 RepID=A0AAF0DNY2_9EURO|nr:hypothetical protein PRK78_007195 [Emydomyces testavorans]